MYKIWKKNCESRKLVLVVRFMEKLLVEEIFSLLKIAKILKKMIKSPVIYT